MAFGARDRRDFPDALDGLEQLRWVHLLLGDLVLRLQTLVHRVGSFRRRLAAQTRQQRRDFRQRDAVVNLDVPRSKACRGRWPRAGLARRRRRRTS